MTSAGDVLNFLIPTGGWANTGNEYEGIQFLECEAITKAEFEAGFAQYEAWKVQNDADKVAAKAAAQSKLAELGLTADDLKALGL
jgi:hypothetical protein